MRGSAFDKLRLNGWLCGSSSITYARVNSIDDNEVQHLRMLMDEIFGADNMLATVVWKPRYSPPNDH